MTSSASAGAGGGQRRRHRLPLAPALALDLGGTRLRGAVVAPDGSLVHREVVPTPRADADTLVEACLALLRRVSADAARRGGPPPLAVGISAPGPIDASRGRLIDPPNLHRTTWGLPLAERIADGVGLPTSLEKDTNVASLGEAWFGAAQGTDDFIYLTVSTGVGGAVVAAGRLLRGADGVGGELGHLVIDAFAGPVCGCGARGHLEALLSGTGIAKAAQEQGLPAGTSAEDIAAAEERGDPLAAGIMGRARDAFAAAMVTMVDVFNPSLVVVGGGIAAGQGDRLLGPARERVAAEAFKVQARRAKIVPAQLGDDVGLAGALVLANAAIDPRIDALGLKPGAMGPGRSALANEPASGDDQADTKSTTDAVALG